MHAALRRTFASLAVRNFRLYFIGQGISLCGTWMRMIALGWLVLTLTHSGTQLGLVTAAQTLPILLLGIFGGVVVDRTDNKRLLVFTQTGLGLASLILGLLVVTHEIHIWMVYVLAIITGLIMVLDNPARQTFVVQMVGEDKLRNAVTLNSTIVNMARIIGPSFAAVLIATVGIGTCFIVDAGTFAAVLIVLFMLKRDELFPVEPTAREPRQLQAGLRYAWSTPALRITLLMMLIIGTFAYEFPVALPVFATKTLHGNATTFSLMTAAMGVGAIVGGLYSAGRAGTKIRELIIVAALFGASVCIASAVPNKITALIVLVFVGALSVLFISVGNTTLQLTSTPQMRGRVMALWSIAFQGTTPIGGPIIGAIIDHSNPRIGLLVGGVSALLASALGLFISGQRLPSYRTIKEIITDPFEK